MIFYLTFGNDAAGTAYADERLLADLHAKANAPLFAAQSVYFGAGAVGGTLISVKELSRDTAVSAVRILNGESPSNVRVPPRSPSPPTFDWRELQRWDIAESRLPSGSTVHYRPPGLWREHRTAVLIAASALAIQAFLIIVLLLERRARQRAERARQHAETDSLRNLMLAADASRRETMTALTNSIAHELSQPINSMTFNAQALQMMVTTNRATSESIGEILSDIQADGVLATQLIERHRAMIRSRELRKDPIELRAVVNESLALLAHDIRERHIAVTIDLPTPSVISGDPVLLLQVLVNLVINAMDAMDATPTAHRRLTIRGKIRTGDVEVSVLDTGSGLPADLIDKLFTPFVTTKSHGLGIGLTIARTIVAAHGGTISASNNPGGGATFTFTLSADKSGAADDVAPLLESDRAHS